MTFPFWALWYDGLSVRIFFLELILYSFFLSRRSSKKVQSSANEKEMGSLTITWRDWMNRRNLLVRSKTIISLLLMIYLDFSESQLEKKLLGFIRLWWYSWTVNICSSKIITVLWIHSIITLSSSARRKEWFKSATINLLLWLSSSYALVSLFIDAVVMN